MKLLCALLFLPVIFAPPLLAQSSNTVRLTGPVTVHNANLNERASVLPAMRYFIDNATGTTATKTMLTLGEADMPNNNGGNYYITKVTGTIAVDANANGNGTSGELIDVTFRLNCDDGASLRIVGQDFLAVNPGGEAGAVRALVDNAGDMTLTADFPTGNTDARGLIRLTEGQSYNFVCYMYEYGGGSNLYIYWQTGDRVASNLTAPVALSTAAGAIRLTAAATVKNARLPLAGQDALASPVLPAARAIAAEAIAQGLTTNVIAPTVILRDEAAVGAALPGASADRSVPMPVGLNADYFVTRVNGTFRVDNQNGTPGEAITLTFGLFADDGADLRIIGQDFTSVSGGWASRPNINGDDVLAADFYVANTNAFGVITLTEGVNYAFEAHHYEGTGEAGMQIYWAVGNHTAFGTMFRPLNSWQVMNTNDSGPGSLRQALADAAANPGPDTITFDPLLSGQTIALGATYSPQIGPTAILITDTGGVTIDATALPGGLTITDGTWTSFRLFGIHNGGIATMRGLTLANGGGDRLESPGAAISNGGTLTMERCTLTGNYAWSYGGAIYSAGTTALSHCTVTGNRAASWGGAIYISGGRCSLTHCTITGNDGQDPGGNGVFVGASNPPAEVVVSQCIIAGNPLYDIFHAGGAITPYVSLGGNIIGKIGVGNGTDAFTKPGDSVGHTAATIKLAPLGNYGGPTPTMPPLRDSPAINAATTVTGLAVDQRGVARGAAMWTNDFSTGLGGGTASGTATLDAGSLRMTQMVQSQKGTFILPDLGNLSSFTATFDYRFTATDNAPADGISFCFGPPPSAPVGETGINPGHSVSFDIYNYPSTVNAAVRYFRSGTIPAGNNAAFLRVGDAGSFKQVTITLTSDGMLTVKYKGAVVLGPLATGYTYAPGDRITFGARTGGSWSEQRIDNIGILTLPVGPADSGAVERIPAVVFTTANDGEGSLRSALADAAFIAGPNTVTFAPPLTAGSVINLDTSLTVADAGGVTIATAITGGNVDVAVNSGTLGFGAGGAWTGGGRILLGAVTGSADATVELNGPNGFSLAAPVVVRAGSSGVKKLRATNTDGSTVRHTNTFAGDITLLDAVTVERTDTAGPFDFMNLDGTVNLGPHVLTLTCDDEVYFNGRVLRDDAGTTPALVVKNGGSYPHFRGTGDNTRLALSVSSGYAYLEKTSSASVHALGSGLPAGTTALYVAPGASAVASNSGGNDQIADSASVTVDGLLAISANETFDGLDGIPAAMVQVWVGARTLTLGAGNGGGNFRGTLGFSGSGTLALTKTGTGIQTLSGASGPNLIGPIQVNGGTLNVTGNYTRCSGATVQSGATLAGSGSVSSIVLADGGFLSPGNAEAAGSIGTLNASGRVAPSVVQGDLTWNGGGIIRCHLGSADNSADRIALAGTLMKGTAGAFLFDFQNTGVAGRTYTLATFSGSSGFTSADFSYANLATGLPGTFTLNADSLTFTVSSLTVSNGNDSGPGSLRAAIAVAALTSGTDTITIAAGFTGPITLANELVIGTDVTVDASAVPGGLTIDGGPGANRLFMVNSGQTLTLQGLALTGGNGAGGYDSGYGGAIYNRGTLTLTQCTLSGNSAWHGGAIYNNYPTSLTLSQCTLSGNSCNRHGGAIYNVSNAMVTHCNFFENGAEVGGAVYSIGVSSTLTMTYCTVSGGSAEFGGGVLNGGSALLTRCTFSENEATNAGGAIYNDSPAGLSVTHCTISGNSAAWEGAAIFNLNSPLTLNHTIAAGNSGAANIYGSFTGGSNLTAGEPRLAPLGNYGGSTPTMALLPGSPARDAAAGSAATSDQRGFPITGTAPDIGAYEAGTCPTYDIWIWENLPSGATAAQHAAAFDYDNDGLSNGDEWNYLTHPASGGSFFAPSVTSTGANVLLTFTSVTGRNYTLQQSDSLAAGSWSNAPVAPIAGDGATKTFTVPAGTARRFFRVLGAP